MLSIYNKTKCKIWTFHVKLYNFLYYTPCSMLHCIADAIDLKKKYHFLCNYAIIKITHKNEDAKIKYIIMHPFTTYPVFGSLQQS